MNYPTKVNLCCVANLARLLVCGTGSGRAGNAKLRSQAAGSNSEKVHFPESFLSDEMLAAGSRFTRIFCSF